MDPKRPGSERIKAFIKLKAEYQGKVTADDIIKHCEERLPPYAEEMARMKEKDNSPVYPL